jgi:transposase
MGAEIISTVERRRRWPSEEKARIMSEALSPGVSISAVANRNGVCRSQLYAWLRLARVDKLAGVSITPGSAGSLIPVRIASDKPSASRVLSADPQASAHPPSPTAVRSRRPAMVEVLLTNGRVVKVDVTIDPDALARLVAVLDGARS